MYVYYITFNHFSTSKFFAFYTVGDDRENF
nr:MAG TPA: hypothetical protein [Caudoviricetes sp.]